MIYPPKTPNDLLRRGADMGTEPIPMPGPTPAPGPLPPDPVPQPDPSPIPTRMSSL
jgi:hypothetical protein